MDVSRPWLKKSAFSGAHARGKGGGCENDKAEQACI